MIFQIFFCNILNVSYIMVPIYGRKSPSSFDEEELRTRSLYRSTIVRDVGTSRP